MNTDETPIQKSNCARAQEEKDRIRFRDGEGLMRLCAEQFAWSLARQEISARLWIKAWVILMRL